jgi:hypothetical protein
MLYDLIVASIGFRGGEWCRSCVFAAAPLVPILPRSILTEWYPVSVGERSGKRHGGAAAGGPARAAAWRQRVREAHESQPAGRRSRGHHPHDLRGWHAEQPPEGALGSRGFLGVFKIGMCHRRPYFTVKLGALLYAHSDLSHTTFSVLKGDTLYLSTFSNELLRLDTNSFIK